MESEDLGGNGRVYICILPVPSKHDFQRLDT